MKKNITIVLCVIILIIIFVFLFFKTELKVNTTQESPSSDTIFPNVVSDQTKIDKNKIEITTFKNEPDKDISINDLCFLYVFEGINDTNIENQYYFADWESFQLWIDGGVVQGKYRYEPSEKDSNHSELSGYAFKDKDGNIIIDAVAMSQGEGMTWVSEEIYLYDIKSSKLLVGSGDMETDVFMDRFTNKNAITFTQSELKKVSCAEMVKKEEKIQFYYKNPDKYLK